MRGIRARTHVRPRKARTRYARARYPPCGSMIPHTRRRHSLAPLARALPWGSNVFVLRATERSHAPVDNHWHRVNYKLTRFARSLPLRVGYVTGAFLALATLVLAPHTCVVLRAAAHSLRARPYARAQCSIAVCLCTVVVPTGSRALAFRAVSSRATLSNCVNMFFGSPPPCGGRG